MWYQKGISLTILQDSTDDLWDIHSVVKKTKNKKKQKKKTSFPSLLTATAKKLEPNLCHCRVFFLMGIHSSTTRHGVTR